MELGFDRDDLLGDIAEGLRHEQGDGFKKTLFYKIHDKAGHPLTTSGHWYDAHNLPGFYEWLTLVKIFGPTFANRSLARLGFKLVPIDGGDIDAKRTLELVENIQAEAGEVADELRGAIENGGGDRKDAA